MSNALSFLSLYELLNYWGTPGFTEGIVKHCERCYITIRLLTQHVFMGDRFLATPTPALNRTTLRAANRFKESHQVIHVITQCWLHAEAAEVSSPLIHVVNMTEAEQTKSRSTKKEGGYQKRNRPSARKIANTQWTRSSGQQKQHPYQKGCQKIPSDSRMITTLNRPVASASTLTTPTCASGWCT